MKKLLSALLFLPLLSIAGTLTDTSHTSPNASNPGAGPTYIMLSDVANYVPAATAAKQDTSNASLSSIDSKTPSLVGGKVPVDAVVSSTALPTGASTSSLQTSGNTILSNIYTILSGGTVPVSGPLTDTQLRASAVPVSISSTVPVSIADPVPVTGTFWQTTQPISNANDGTKITAATMPAGGSGFLGWLSAIWYQLTQTLTVSVSGTVPVSGTFWQATQPISATALPLPSGAATDTLQTSGNASLSSIDSKTPALGQALAAGSVPVVLTASQLSTLTPLSTVAATQSGTWTNTVTQGTATNLKTQAESYQGGTAVGAANPLQVTLANTGSNSTAITTTNGAIGTNASTAPTKGIQVGGTDQSGNFQSNTIRPLNVQVVGTDEGLVTNTVIHGLTTGGGGGYVDVKVNPSGALSVDGSGVTQPVSGTVTVQQSTASNLKMDLSGSAANSTAGLLSVKIDQTTNGSTNAVSLRPSATGNGSLYTVDSGASTNAANIKASAGSLLWVTAINTTGATKYVRIYNKATTPTVGTDVAIIVLAVAATSSDRFMFPYPATMGSGIGISITGAAAYNDTTAVAAHDVQVALGYQ